MTPSYQGPGQPPADNGGVFDGLGSIFSVSTPAYAGAGQLRSATGSSTPAYAPAPASPPADSMTCGTCGQVLVTCPVDPNAIAAGQIAIVIPRTGPIE